MVNELNTWFSIDPASTSAIAVWSGSELKCSYILSKMGTKGNYKIIKEGGQIKMDSRYAAWQYLFTLHRPSCVIMEEGFGKSTNAVKSQAELRGYVRCLSDSFSVDSFQAVNVSSWRRAIKDLYNVSFPKDSDLCKSLSRQLVEKIYGLIVTDDEADAILLGTSSIRSGMVPGVQI